MDFMDIFTPQNDRLIATGWVAGALLLTTARGCHLEVQFLDDPDSFFTESPYYEFEGGVEKTLVENLVHQNYMFDPSQHLAV